MSSTTVFVRRIAVGDPNGPYSSTLRIWIQRGRGDVYAGMREIAGEMKISLHESGECNAAMTTDFTRDDAELLSAMGGTRHLDQWIRGALDFTPFSIPLQIAFPASELRSWLESPDFDNSITWIAPPEPGHSVIVSCVFSQQQYSTDDWPRKNVGSQLVASHVLPNGEVFWIIYERVTTSPLEHSMLAEAQRIRQGPGLIPRAQQIDPLDAPRVLIGRLVPEGTLALVDAAANSNAE